MNKGYVKANKSGSEVDIHYAKNVRFSIDGESIEIVNVLKRQQLGLPTTLYR